MIDRRPINVLGVGAIAAPGYGPSQIIAACGERQSRTRAGSAWPIGPRDDQLLGEIREFDPARYIKLRGMRPLSRTSQLCCVVAAAAIGFPDPLPFQSDDFGVVLGTRWGSIEPLAEFDRSAALNGPHLVNPAHFPNVVVNAHAGYLGVLFRLAGPNVTLCGAGAGMEAIVHAVDLLDLGRADAILAGGVEALGPTLLQGQASTPGVAPPGEGAAMLLLSRHCTDRPVLARLVGWASATAMHVEDIEVVRAMVLRKVLADTQARTITTVWHAGGATAAFRSVGIGHDRIQSLMHSTGNCEAATGAIAAALGVEQVVQGAEFVLVTAFPTIGTQSALLFA